MRLLVLNGPNLNLLKEREPDLYGTQTLDELNASLEEYVHINHPDTNLDFFQSNHEGDLIDVLQAARLTHDGVVFNPAAYAHTSVALRDAIAAIAIPVAEVHLSDISLREPFRHLSLIAPVCVAQFIGEGGRSYQKALSYLIKSKQRT